MVRLDLLLSELNRECVNGVRVARGCRVGAVLRESELRPCVPRPRGRGLRVRVSP